MITVTLPDFAAEDSVAAEKLVKLIPKRSLAKAVAKWYCLSAKYLRDIDYWKTHAEAKDKEMADLEKDLERAHRHVSFIQDEVDFKQHQIDILIENVDRLMEMRKGSDE